MYASRRLQSLRVPDTIRQRVREKEREKERERERETQRERERERETDFQSKSKPKPIRGRLPVSEAFGARAQPLHRAQRAGIPEKH